MRLLNRFRWYLLALLLALVPASSYAGVFISVGFAPPVLPVYDQPPCPEPNLMWTPGYWAYGPDGYYWVPGAWVPAPYTGALWTPPYWGYEGAVYVFHPGYWGPHVGYYGGVNYGFGYMGIGFVGGMWRGNVFSYNTAIVHVNDRIIRTTYVDRTIIQRNTIVNDRRVAYAGGPGGIRHDPTPQERVAMRETHMAPTSFQQRHFDAARGDHAAYFNANHGRPQNVAAARPLQAERRPAPAAGNAGPRTGYNNARPGAANSRPGFQQQSRPANQPQSRPAQGYQQGRSAQGYQQSRPAQQQFQQRPAQQPQARPAPQGRSESAPRNESRPHEESHPRR